MRIHDDDDFDAALLGRYLAAESSPEEDEVVRRRFGDDLRPRILAAFAATEDSTPVDTVAAWRALRARTSRESVHLASAGRKQRVWRSTGFRIAASLVLVAGVGTAVRQLSSYRQQQLNERVVQTATGERRDVLLPDRTLVTLAPKSRLTYPATFAAGQRDVQLTGEAFFSVAHDSTRPFTVRTAGATARVIGTEFGVRARTGQPVDVYVASGRVRVAPPNDSAGPVLSAGDLGRVGVGVGRGQVAVTHSASIGDFLAWREGRIVATARPAAEVFDELGRWFDATFTIADPALAARSVSVDLRVGNGVSLESVLDALMLTLDARYMRAGKGITVSAR